MQFPNDTIRTITELVFLRTEYFACDIALVTGNDYIKTMDSVKWLYDNHYIRKKIVISGHSAKRDRIPEAIRFFEYGKEIGIPADTMVLETNAQNTYENLLYSKTVIEEKISSFSDINSVLFVAKAFVTRRIQMTAQAIYPPHLAYCYFPIVDKEGRNIGCDNWWHSEFATRRVLEEMERIATYTLKGDLSLIQK